MLTVKQTQTRAGEQCSGSIDIQTPGMYIYGVCISMVADTGGCNGFLLERARAPNQRRLVLGTRLLCRNNFWNNWNVTA